MSKSIDYYESAVYLRRELGAWTSYGEMPLYKAVLLAIRKYRTTAEPTVSSKSLHLVGIDSIVAVRERLDFPTDVEADGYQAAEALHQR